MVKHITKKRRVLKNKGQKGGLGYNYCQKSLNTIKRLKGEKDSFLGKIEELNKKLGECEDKNEELRKRIGEILDIQINEGSKPLEQGSTVVTNVPKVKQQSKATKQTVRNSPSTKSPSTRQVASSLVETAARSQGGTTDISSLSPAKFGQLFNNVTGIGGKKSKRRRKSKRKRKRRLKTKRRRRRRRR